MQYHTPVCCYQWWPLALALQPHQHSGDIKYNSATSNVILHLYNGSTNSIYYTIHCHTMGPLMFISLKPLCHKTTQPNAVILSSSTHGTPLVQSKYLVRANCCIVVVHKSQLKHSLFIDLILVLFLTHPVFEILYHLMVRKHTASNVNVSICVLISAFLCQTSFQKFYTPLYRVKTWHCIKYWCQCRFKTTTTTTNL